MEWSCSSTITFSPACARYAAADSPPTPAPIMIASVLSMKSLLINYIWIYCHEYIEVKYMTIKKIKKVDLMTMKEFLMQQRSFLVRLLENPALLEHAEFTEVLRALFHLTEELDSRDRLSDLPETDYAHLAGDIQRVYNRLVSQWLDYMEYLKNNYPYLFSLAIRKNPFDETASPIVRYSRDSFSTLAAAGI